MSSTSRADTLDLGGNPSARINFDETPGVPYTIVQNGSLLLTNNGALTFAGLLRDNDGSGGIFSLQTFGSGTLTLSGANTYTGGTTINGGALNVADSSALGTGDLVFTASATLQAGAAGLTTANNAALQGTLTVNTKGNSYTLAGTLQDLTTAGTLLKAGLGRLTLSGTNSYTGGTRVEGGSVVISADAGLGAATGTLTLAGGGLALTGSDGVAMNRNIVLSDTGGLVSVDNVYGVLGVKGTISGSGSLTKAGFGKLELYAANSYSGGTLVIGGSLNVGAAGALGTGRLIIGSSFLEAATDGLSFDNPVTLYNAAIDTNEHNLTLTGPVSGTNVTVYGAGTLTLTGDNTLGSGITVATGGIAVGSNTALGLNTLAMFGGTSLIAAADNLVLANYYQFAGSAPITIDTRATTLTLNGQINQSGSGVTINKAGSGTLIVGGDWNGSGGGIDTIVEGTLQIQTGHTIYAGQLEVNSGATLSGSGSVLSPDAGTTIVTVDPGGTLSPGTLTPGTLRLANLSLTAGSLVDFTLGKAGVVGGTNNDLVIVNGQLTLAGTLNVANGPLFTKGDYTLFTYGTVTDNGLVVGTLPPGYNGSVAVVANNAGPGGTVVLQALGAGRQYWDGSGAIADHIVSGGSGTWNTASFNWTSVDGASNSAWNSQQAVFNTVGGTVAVAGAQQFTLLEFDVGGYHLSGTNLAARSPDGVAAPEINTAAATATIIDNLLTGSKGLLKSGLGTLTLNGANTFTGAVSITGGRVNAGAAGAFSGNAVELFDGTTLGAGAAITLTNALKLDNVGVVDSNGFALTLSGVISGPGNLTIADTGASPFTGLVTLTGINSHAGTTISSARAAVAVDSALGTAMGSLALNGGTLLTSASFGSARAVTLTGDSSFAPANATTLTLSGAIGGTGSLRQAGPGTLVLTGINSYAAGTLVNAGVLSIGADTNLGASDGGLSLLGATLQLTGDVIALRPVTIAGANTIDTGASTLTLGGLVTNTGTLTKTGAGTLVLNGVNSSVAPTALIEGTIQAGSNSAIGGGGLTMSDGTTLAGSGIVALPDAVTIAGVGTIDSGSDSLRLDGIVSGTGSVIKHGAGTLQLYGDNSFNGLNIVTGSVLLGGNTAAGSGAIMLSSDGTLAAGVGGLVVANAVITQGGNVDSGAGAFTLGGPVTGDGGFTKLGSGTLMLTGDNSYAGATSVDTGTLAVNGANSGGGAVDVLAGATLTGSGTIAGVVSIANGATLSPGDGVGRLTTGGLVLGNSATLTYQLGQANVVGGPSNDLLQVNGNLTLGGKLNVTDSGGFGTGVYRIINYTGALTNNGLAVNSLPGLYAAQIQTVVAGTVNLLVTTPNALIQYWDGADMTGNGVINGGSGSWTVTNRNWTTPDPSIINDSWAGGVAVFSNTAGTVVVTGTQAFQGLQFTTAGYALTGGTLAASTGSFIATSGGTTTIASALTGGGISKQGTGTLALTGDNSFAALFVTTGTISLGANTAGGSGNIALADGTTLASTAAGLQLVNTISTAGTATIDTGENTLTLNGVVAGPGSLNTTGALVLNGANNFTGLTISGGSVTIGNDSAPGNGAINFTGIGMFGKPILVAGVSGLELSNAISTFQAGTVDSGSGSLTLNGSISGQGSITRPVRAISS